MNCPKEIANILLKILSEGLLRIRASADDAERCFDEADHLHNLPNLLADYSPELLDFYWDVERPSYIARTPRTDLDRFERLWEELARARGDDGTPRRTAKHHAPLVETP